MTAYERLARAVSGGGPSMPLRAEMLEVLRERDALLHALEAIDRALSGLRGEIAEAAEVDVEFEGVDEAIDVLRAAIKAARGGK